MRGKRASWACVFISILALSGSHAAAGQGPAEDVLCRYVEVGAPGPADNELQITTNDYVGEVEIVRSSDEIQVSEDDDDPLVCSGGVVPSVSNLDRISVRVSREALDSLTLDQRSGSFSPGATAETDGTSEIEISLGEAPGTVLAVHGTASSDYVQLGSVGGGNYGANLNGAIEPIPDADVTGRNAYVFLGLGAGDDRVDSLGRAAFADRAFNFAFAAWGGHGDDVLIGNDRRNVFVGGRGRDRLVGKGLRDHLRAGPDADRIDARDRGRDLVGCGQGEDRVRADRVDRRRGCE